MGIEEELSNSRERINSLQYQLKTNTVTQSQTLANYVRQLEKQVKDLQQQNITCEKKVGTLQLEKEALLTR